MHLPLPSKYIVGYVRVSSSEQIAGWSPANQADAIRKFADARDLVVVEIFEDLGRSGTRLRNRFGLRRLLETLVTGGIGAVVVAREDRLGRNLRDGFKLSAAIHETGSHIIAIDPFVHDPGPKISTTDQRLMRSLFQIIGQGEVDTLRKLVIQGLKTAAENGRPGGHTPFGYRKLLTGEFVIQPDDAAIIRRCFHEVAQGVTVSALLRQLAQENVRRSTGKRMTFDLIRGILENPFMHGCLIYRPAGQQQAIIRHDQHHPAIVDMQVFLQVRQVLQRVKRTTKHMSESTPPTATTSETPQSLSATDLVVREIVGPPRSVHGIIPPKIARCGACGEKMYASLQTCGGRHRRTKKPSYICHRHKKEGTASCPQSPASTHSIDDQVTAQLRRAIKSGKFSNLLTPTLPPALHNFDSQIKQQQDKLAHLQKGKAHGIESETLNKRMTELEQSIAALQTARQQHANTKRLPIGPRDTLLQNFDTTWPSLTNSEQRSVIDWLVSEVRIDDKNVISCSFVTLPTVVSQGAPND